MPRTNPRVYLIAETVLRHEHRLWLEDQKGTTVLQHTTGNGGEQLIELAGRRCYRSFDVGLNPNVTKVRTDSEEYHKNILSSRHGSVLEHTTGTFAFEGVSRVFTHEQVRHRAGCAYSQESLRYVRLDQGIDYWVPPEIEADANLKRLFVMAMDRATQNQRELVAVSGIENEKNFDKKKKLTSAFRRIAPDGLATGIVATFNMRALRHLIELRTSRHAEYEIRLVFNMVAKIAKEHWPYLFQDFTAFDTGDGDVREWKPEFSKV